MDGHHDHYIRPAFQRQWLMYKFRQEGKIRCKCRLHSGTGLCCYKIEVITTEVVIINSWIVTVYPSAPWEPTCSTYHNFPFLFRLPRTCLFNDREAHECLFSLHEKYVIVLVDKASNNIAFVGKAHYINMPYKELGIDNNIPDNAHTNVLLLTKMKS